MHVKKVTEQRMLECLPDPKFKDDYSLHLASIYATCEDPDNYNINEDTDQAEPTDENALLKDLKDNMSVEGNKTAIEFLRNKVLENVKERVLKTRRRRDSSVGSITSNSSKRKSGSDHEKTESKSSKLTEVPKPSAIPKLANEFQQKRKYFNLSSSQYTWSNWFKSIQTNANRNFSTSSQD